MQNHAVKKSLWSKNKTKYLVRVALLSAIAFVLVLLEVPYPLSEHLKIDFSDIIAIIGGIAMGPVASIIVIVVKNLLKAVNYSTTGGIGELVLIFVGLAYTLPIVFIYRKFKSNKGLIIGMVVGIVSMTVIAAITNYFIAIPLYMGQVPSAQRIAMILSIYTPFNIIKGIVVSIVTFVLLKSAPILINIVRIQE